jgi:hypothetical protein
MLLEVFGVVYMGVGNVLIRSFGIFEDRTKTSVKRELIVPAEASEVRT